MMQETEPLPGISSKVEGNNPKRGKKFKTAGRIAISGLAIAGTLSLGERAKNEFFASDPTPLLPNSSNSLSYSWSGDLDRKVTYHDLQNENRLTDDEITVILAREYLAARSALSQLTHHDFLIDSLSDDRLIQDQQDLLVEGLLILERQSEDTFVQVDSETATVHITGMRDLDLNAAVDRMLLDKYVFHKIGSSLEDNSEKKAEEQKKANDITWLINSDVPIEIENDEYAFWDDDNLILLSRFYQLMKDVHPIPPKVILSIYDNDDPGAGWYNGNVHVTNIANDSTSIHEIAHYISDVSEEFSQEEFERRIEAVVQQEDTSMDTIDLTKIFTEPGLDLTPVEDYAVTVSQYFTNGDAFRQRMKEVRTTSGGPISDEFRILSEKYQFAKDFFGGLEFGKDGAIFMPEEGDIYVIDDPDPYNFPIGLRNDDGDGYAPPFVYNGTQVQVLNGQKKEYYRYMDMEVDFLYVEATTQSGRIGRGWIADIWLGEKIVYEDIDNK